MKKAFSILFLILIAGAVYYWYMFIRIPAYESCIQMIQPAQNPLTKEVRVFNNPCQIPIGWQKIDTLNYRLK